MTSGPRADPTGRLPIRRDLKSLGLDYPVSYDDLWRWHDKWSSEDPPSYRSRRECVAPNERADTYWVPAVDNLRTLGRWAFAELTEIYRIDADFKAKVDREFDGMLARVGGASTAVSA